MARLYVLLFLVQIVLAVLALISCLSAEEDEIRALPRLAWVLIIVIVPLIGAIAWYLAGRPVKERTAGGWRGGGGLPEHKRSRPAAPDDDPEFLKSLDTGQSQQDRELFEKWEEDLRRREDEIRRRETGEESTS
jgi:hypothetical protein